MNTRIIIIIIGLMLMLGRGYAQIPAEGQKMQGRWEIVKVEATLFSQGDERVLERKVLTAKGDISMAGGMIPLSLGFNGDVCTVERNGRIERDSCKWEPPFVLLQDPESVLVRYHSWQYSFIDADHIEVGLPAVFYMDPQRKVPVKRQFICTYGKKG
ncbi:hypothetical protein [Chitinophaga varians]|uniref:hypothetical protein n=1 Tax=Chitinophaga varians TaxID=2202339 RepID=UPI00165FDDD2|nr:hypothetical protein [Chitinophaga varians]MBC9913355.1 hypothetical protein [Chitinophaga varians]